MTSKDKLKVKVLKEKLEKESGKKVILQEDKKTVKLTPTQQNYLTIKNSLGPKQVITFGKTVRDGYQKVKGGLKKIFPILLSQHQNSIQQISDKYNIKWDEAYVQFFQQGADYTNRGGGLRMQFVLFGTDGEGNKYMYDKYEGQVAGGGNSFLKGGGKKIKVTDAINYFPTLLVKLFFFDSKKLPKISDFSRFYSRNKKVINQAFNSGKTDLSQVNNLKL